MKIAVPTRNNQVDDHFGHCEQYTLFTISEDKKVEHVELLNAPPGCGCKSAIIPLLRQKGVNTMLAGNMGQGAVDKLTRAGISVFRGCSGNIRELVDLYLLERVTDSGQTCDQHQHGHSDHHRAN